MWTRLLAAFLFLALVQTVDAARLTTTNRVSLPSPLWPTRFLRLVLLAFSHSVAQCRISGPVGPWPGQRSDSCRPSCLGTAPWFVPIPRNICGSCSTRLHLAICELASYLVRSEELTTPGGPDLHRGPVHEQGRRQVHDHPHDAAARRDGAELEADRHADADCEGGAGWDVSTTQAGDEFWVMSCVCWVRMGLEEGTTSVRVRVC